MSLDFLFYSLIYHGGLEGDQAPDMLVKGAPKIVHRHRKDDLLALNLNLEEKGSFSQKEHPELVEAAYEMFFQTQGSVTRAIQAACDLVNKNLLDQNIQLAYEGGEASGSVNIAVLHNGWLFFGQYGNTASIVITEESFQKFGGKQEIEERLGLSKHIQVRYYQSEVKDGDIFILSPDPPETWNAYNLSGATMITVDQLHRRLMNQVTSDLTAAVIKLSAGSGQALKKAWPVQREAESKIAHISGENSDSLPNEISVSNDIQTLDETEEVPGLGESEKKDGFEVTNIPQDIESTDLLQEEVAVVAGETELDQHSESGQSETVTDNPKENSFLYLLARFWMRGKTARARTRRFFEKSKSKFVPGKLQELSIRPLLLTIFAFGIPAVIVLFSLTIYSRTGKSQQYELLMTEANQVAELARNAKDSIQKHEYWSQALQKVRQAEEYRTTQDSRMLYEQAQYLLDEMDLAARLDFRPALTDFLAEGVVISRIESSSSGVYLLDESSGSILRIFLNSKGFYELDSEFECSPGLYGLEAVSSLIDLVVLPANTENYRVMAVDGTGNLLYCRPGEAPDSRTLPAPEGGWGKISGIDMEGSALFVLDAEKDAVWIFAGKDPERLDIEGATGIVFSESPQPFFDEESPDLAGALDMVSNGEDLYLLHQDGHMTLCRYAPIKEVNKTECQDPAPYTDNRVGRENKNPWIFMDAHFIMMEEARLPNSAIYLLDTTGPAVYQFGFQLNLEKTLKPQQNQNYPLPVTAPSGIGITSDMDIFIAFDNRLYIAPLKP